MCPKTSTEPDAYDLNTDIALFRYGLIAQLVHTPPDTGQQERLLREIAARTYTIPGSTRTRVSITTLRRYLNTYRAYREQGFEALRPGPRTDAGTHAPSHPRCSPKRLRCAKSNPPARRKRSWTFYVETRA